jgi:hypothetical protein
MAFKELDKTNAEKYTFIQNLEKGNIPSGYYNAQRVISEGEVNRSLNQIQTVL